MPPTMDIATVKTAIQLAIINAAWATNTVCLFEFPKFHYGRTGISWKKATEICFHLYLCSFYFRITKRYWGSPKKHTIHYLHCNCPLVCLSVRTCSYALVYSIEMAAILILFLTFHWRLQLQLPVAILRKGGIEGRRKKERVREREREGERERERGRETERKRKRSREYSRWN